MPPETPSSLEKPCASAKKRRPTAHQKAGKWKTVVFPQPVKPGATVESQPRAEAPTAKSASGNGHSPAVDFNQLRNEVLTLARRLSSTSKQDIAGVVSRASDGSFQYSDIGRMTPADLPKVQAAVQRLKEAVDLQKA